MVTRPSRDAGIRSHLPREVDVSTASNAPGEPNAGANDRTQRRPRATKAGLPSPSRTRSSSRRATSPCSTAATSRSRASRSTSPGYRITALIGPSGCGKSTLLRSFNRMNDLIVGAEVQGRLAYHGQDLYASERRPGRGPPPHRHGVPEAEPVPEVDLRQRRVRAADQRQAQGPRRHRARARSSAPRCGTRSRTSSRSPRSRSRAGSSSGCASRVASRSSPT